MAAVPRQVASPSEHSLARTLENMQEARRKVQIHFAGMQRLHRGSRLEVMRRRGDLKPIGVTHAEVNAGVGADDVCASGNQSAQQVFRK